MCKAKDYIFRLNSGFVNGYIQEIHKGIDPEKVDDEFADWLHSNDYVQLCTDIDIEGDRVDEDIEVHISNGYVGHDTIIEVSKKYINQRKKDYDRLNIPISIYDIVMGNVFESFEIGYEEVLKEIEGSVEYKQNETVETEALKNTYTVVNEHMHGDGDLYEKNEIICKNEMELLILAHAIELRAYDSNRLNLGMILNDIIKKYMDYYDQESIIEKLESIFQEVYGLEDYNNNDEEFDLLDYYYESLGKRDITCNDVLSQIVNTEFRYYDENGSSYTVLTDIKLK